MALKKTMCGGKNLKTLAIKMKRDEHKALHLPAVSKSF
jgi:hypothetical protein